jgi:hypothetical protein
VIPHHTNVHSESSYERFWTQHDFSTHNPAFERLIEITQDRGSMEKDEVGENVYIGGLGSSVQAALACGMKVGFVGGTDNHRAQPSEPRSPLGGLDPDEVTVGGMTAVYAPELTREAVYSALHARRCYATQGQRTLLQFALGGWGMGSVVPRDAAMQLGETRSLSYSAIGHRAIMRVEVVRCDGQTFDVTPSAAPTLGLLTGEFDDTQALPEIDPSVDAVWYYPRVTEIDGRMAWSSPIWLMVG